MRMLVKSAIAIATVTVAAGAALVIAAGPAQALPIPAPTPATHADIECTAGTPTGPVTKGITTQASGSGYPANVKILVIEVISYNGSVRSGTKSEIGTSTTGDWSTPVNRDRTATAPGLYEYNVTVTDPDGKTTYGTAYDACKD